MDGETICGICRPLSGGCKDHGIAPHKQRNTRKNEDFQAVWIII